MERPAEGDGKALERFLAAARAGERPDDLPPLLQALWEDAQGRWERAHEMAQHEHGVAAAWVHAYLHRKEGDLGNARYWYGRANREEATGSLEHEWAAIASALLEGSGS